MEARVDRGMGFPDVGERGKRDFLHLECGKEIPALYRAVTEDPTACYEL